MSTKDISLRTEEGDEVLLLMILREVTRILTYTETQIQILGLGLQTIDTELELEINHRLLNTAIPTLIDP
jgi:hypothetical protein